MKSHSYSHEFSYQQTKWSGGILALADVFLWEEFSSV